MCVCVISLLSSFYYQQFHLLQVSIARPLFNNNLHLTSADKDYECETNDERPPNAEDIYRTTVFYPMIDIIANSLDIRFRNLIACGSFYII